MGTYDSIVTRADVDGLIPVEYSTELANAIVAESALLSLGKRLRNMKAYEAKMPVMSTNTTAYFLSGETGTGQTTEPAWTDMTLAAEEVIAVVPMSRSVYNDSSVDIFRTIYPDIVSAFATVIDNAGFFGTNEPATWNTAIGGDGIAGACSTKSNTVAIGTGDDLYEDILGDDGLFSLVEADGFTVTGVAAGVSMRGKLRSVRDSNGNPIFYRDMNAGVYMLDTVPIYFMTTSNNATNRMIAGDYSKLVYSIREDISWMRAETGTITDPDNSNAVVYNLFQQDMVAFRFTMRLGVGVANPVNRIGSSGYPFATLTDS